MRIVVDTNLIASAIFFGGLPYKLAELIPDDKITAVVTESIFKEYEGTIHDLYQTGNKSQEKTSLSALVARMEFIEPRSEIKLCRDPGDDKFLECAVDGFCSYIVSGDKDLLVLQNYGDIRIVKVRDFFDEYGH